MRLVWLAIGGAQAVLGVRVLVRMLNSGGGARVRRTLETLRLAERVAVLVPVLNEAERLAPCLEGLIAQGVETAEIIVIDGGSTDGTTALVRAFVERDARVRLIEAGAAPAGINGKAWGLQAGLDRIAATATTTDWILTIDADVRPAPELTRSLVAHALGQNVAVLSAATRQRLSGPGQGLIHPALLTTLVYRFGIPGKATRDPRQVQANGQCFLIRRDALAAVGGFGAFTGSVCEDVTLARAAAASGRRVGFYETEGLVSVEMYRGMGEAWVNWTRSLPMMDRFTPGRVMPGLAELALVQAAPTLLVLPAVRRLGPRHPVTLINAALLACRFGVLCGTARAYESRPWTYWLSPLADGPAAMQIWLMSMRRRHVWRGRAIIAGDVR